MLILFSVARQCRWAIGASSRVRRQRHSAASWPRKSRKSRTVLNALAHPCIWLLTATIGHLFPVVSSIAGRLHRTPGTVCPGCAEHRRHCSRESQSMITLLSRPRLEWHCRVHCRPGVAPCTAAREGREHWHRTRHCLSALPGRSPGNSTGSFRPPSSLCSSEAICQL